MELWYQSMSHGDHQSEERKGHWNGKLCSSCIWGGLELKKKILFLRTMTEKRKRGNKRDLRLSLGAL